MRTVLTTALFIKELFGQDTEEKKQNKVSLYIFRSILFAITLVLWILQFTGTFTLVSIVEIVVLILWTILMIIVCRQDFIEDTGKTTGMLKNYFLFLFAIWVAVQLVLNFVRISSQ